MILVKYIILIRNATPKKPLKLNWKMRDSMIWQAQKIKSFLTVWILYSLNAIQYKCHLFLALCLNVSRTEPLIQPMFWIELLLSYLFLNEFNGKAQDFQSGYTQAQVFIKNIVIRHMWHKQLYSQSLVMAQIKVFISGQRLIAYSY